MKSKRGKKKFKQSGMRGGDTVDILVPSVRSIGTHRGVHFVLRRVGGTSSYGSEWEEEQTNDISPMGLNHGSVRLKVFSSTPEDPYVSSNVWTFESKRRYLEDIIVELFISPRNERGEYTSADTWKHIRLLHPLPSDMTVVLDIIPHHSVVKAVEVPEKAPAIIQKETIPISNIIYINRVTLTNSSSEVEEITITYAKTKQSLHADETLRESSPAPALVTGRRRRRPRKRTPAVRKLKYSNEEEEKGTSRDNPTGQSERWTHESDHSYMSSQCQVCGNIGEDGKTYTCSLCKGAVYCGKKCQVEDWQKHKRSECTRLAKGREE